MLKLCKTCKGAGCEDCNFEGVDADVTFTQKKIIRNKTMKFNDYQNKKQQELNKIDKKNIREDF